MKRGFAMALLCGMSLPAWAGNGARWDYTGPTGPEKWATLRPENSACAGKNQSPVNLTGFVDADLPPIQFLYRAGGYEVVHNGHTLQLSYAAGSSIQLDGARFALKQLHFHAPSENLIEGRSFPLEAHLVHADDEGNLAVVAVMFETGPENPVLAKLWSLAPRAPGEKHALPAPIAIDGLLPANRDHYLYHGSLTTPPCTEGVRWLVLKTPVTASTEQIAAFVRRMHRHTNRPVQALNGRPVLK